MKVSFFSSSLIILPETEELGRWDSSFVSHFQNLGRTIVSSDWKVHWQRFVRNICASFQLNKKNGTFQKTTITYRRRSIICIISVSRYAYLCWNVCRTFESRGRAAWRWAGSIRRFFSNISYIRRRDISTFVCRLLCFGHVCRREKWVMAKNVLFLVLSGSAAIASMCVFVQVLRKLDISMVVSHLSLDWIWFYNKLSMRRAENFIDLPLT